MLKLHHENKRIGRWRWKKWNALIICTFVCCCAFGCSSKGNVTGTVTCNNQKVDRVIVTFVSGDNVTKSKATDSDGVFRIEDLPAGNWKVAVTNGPMKISPFKSGRKTAFPTNEHDIPDKYKKAATSGLVCEVKAGETVTFDIKLP